MTISKIQAESINLSDTFAFTGTVTGAGDEAKILSFGSYNSGYGSGARLVTSTTSWVNLEINGTNQAVFGQITKNSDDSLNYNKTSQQQCVTYLLIRQEKCLSKWRWPFSVVSCFLVIKVI